MAQPGESIANPVTGERVVFRTTAAESDGALLAMDYCAPAGYVIAPAWKTVKSLFTPARVT